MRKLGADLAAVADPKEDLAALESEVSAAALRGSRSTGAINHEGVTASDIDMLAQYIDGDRLRLQRLEFAADS